MDFADQVRQLIGLLDKNKDHVSTEEATKHSMVMPFLQVMGYNVFDPTEIIPEFTEGKGVRKGEKVDYAIVLDSQPVMLIEVKNSRSSLRPKTSDQLLRYFFGVTKSRFAILTNGIQYQFFSDLNQDNIMDDSPFLTVDLTPSIRDTELGELRRFHKTYFDVVEVRSIAKDLKLTGEIKRYLKQQFKEPDEDLIRFFIKKIDYPGMVTKQVIEKFSPIVQSALRQYIKEMVSDFAERVSEEATKAATGEDGGERTKDILRRRFWTQLLSYAKTKTELHSKISPTGGGWIGAGAGMSGFAYCYSITKHHGTVELYIGRKEESENASVFERLASARSEIEKIFGGPLEWERLEGKKACKLRKTITGGGYLDEKAWPKVQEDMVESMISLEKALAPQLQRLS